MRIAVIGAGVSGCVAARLLSTRHDVKLFDAADYPGGHANTVVVAENGRPVAVDTGFMVFNQRTYPNFCRLLGMLGIDSRPSDMSFSVRDDARGLEYQGSSLNGVFSQRANLLRPRFLGMLRDIIRFNSCATRAVQAGSVPRDQTVEGYLDQHRLGSGFRNSYFLPMAAAIWSCSPSDIAEFPAHFMLGFFANHGLLQLKDRPQWKTIPGGSNRYVRQLLDPIAGSVRLCSPVTLVRRLPGGGVLVVVDGEEELFDHVVLAVHADQALAVLDDASPEEQAVLNCFPYRRSRAVLHTDTSLLPRRVQAWASWNYYVPTSKTAGATVTYDLRRLQGLRTDHALLLTLNDAERIAPAKILDSFEYAHPAYSLRSVSAQARHADISGVRHTHYCGAYWGFGFHEDGVNSALRVAAAFGLGLESCRAAFTKV